MPMLQVGSKSSCKQVSKLVHRQRQMRLVSLFSAFWSRKLGAFNFFGSGDRALRHPGDDPALAG
jgi:hypothetical protein